MMRLMLVVFLAVAGIGVAQVANRGEPKRLLVVSHSVGYVHDATTTGEQVLMKLGEEGNRWRVTICRTENDVKTMLTPSGLSGFDGVVFNNTGGDLPIADLSALVEWVREGRAFVGIHGAAATLQESAIYREFLGGIFRKHGEQCEVEAQVEDAGHPAGAPLAPRYHVFDEIYLFDAFNCDRVHVIVSLDVHPPDGSPEGNAKQAGDYPLAWCKPVGKGRLFYSSFGHREEVWADIRFQEHLAGGISWALGLAEASTEPPPRAGQIPDAGADSQF